MHLLNRAVTLTIFIIKAKGDMDYIARSTEHHYEEISGQMEHHGTL